MSRGLNKVMVIGRLGKDPEMRYIPNGTAVTSFSVAADRTYTSNGEKKTETEWFNCTAWAKLAEITNQYCKKGQLVYVEGRLKTEKYEKDGQTHYSVKVVADQVNMLTGGNGNGGAPEEEAAQEGQTVQFA